MTPEIFHQDHLACASEQKRATEHRATGHIASGTGTTVRGGGMLRKT